MTLACLRLLGQVQVYNPAIQREMLMLLVLLAVIGMVCLLGAARAIREPRKVLIVGASIVAVLLIVSVLASLAMLFFTPRAITYAARDEQSAAEARAATAEAESFRTSISSKVVVQSDESTAGSVAEGLPPRQQLFSDVVDTWQADVYPSERAAVRALVGRIDKQIDRMTADQKEPAEIQVQGNVRHELLVQVVDALKKTHADSRITFAQTPEESAMPPADKRTVVVHVLSNQGAKGITPYVRMQAVGWEHSTTEQANFVNKPWVDDFADFVNQDHDRNWILAISPSPVTSAEEAERAALDMAAGKLAPLVQEQLAFRGRIGGPYVCDRPLLAAEVRNAQMVADRFAQMLKAPYGQVWQTSLLIDASPKMVARLTDKCDLAVMKGHRQRLGTALSVLGLVCIVCFVYAVLNAVTRGYFVSSLRAVGLAIIVAALGLLVLARGQW